MVKGTIPDELHNWSEKVARIGREIPVLLERRDLRPESAEGMMALLDGLRAEFIDFQDQLSPDDRELEAVEQIDRALVKLIVTVGERLFQLRVARKIGERKQRSKL